MNQKNFCLRTVICFFLVAVIMLVCATRVALLCDDETLKNVAVGQSSYKLKLYDNRGMIYDSKMRPLTNTTSVRMCVLPPNSYGVAAAQKLFSGAVLTNALKTLNSGFPITAPLGNSDLPYGTIEYYSPERYSCESLCHVIGYTGANNRGVSGVELGFDELLYSEDYTYASFFCDATGDIVANLQGGIEYSQNDNYLQLTIDRDIQNLSAEALSGVQKGAAVVVEAKTGKIRAMISKPFYNQQNAATDLNAENSPFLNRAISLYSIGSIFKPCVLAAAIEQGFDLTTHYDCGGKITVGSRNFKCHKLSGHGSLSAIEAIAESCNVFFYNLSFAIGREPITDMARSCGFSSCFDLGGSLIGPAGSLPSEQELSDSALCNLSIGQGEMLISPVVISNLYCAVVNGGYFISPTVIESVCDGAVQTATKTAKSVVMKEGTAEIIKEYLIYSITHGTGQKADPQRNMVCGGKTATAQTGKIENGKRILDGWYCGFIEVCGTEYVICILVEDVGSGAGDCAPVFSRIASGIYDLFN